MDEVEGIGKRRRSKAQERLLSTASELFYREGIGATGVDTVSERASVSKRTLYNRYGGKDALISAYLRDRDEQWWAYLRGVSEGIADPEGRLMVVFDAYGEWLSGHDFRGCAFANAQAEIADPGHPALAVARGHKERIEEHMATLAREAKYSKPEVLAEKLLLLLEGAVAMAVMRRTSGPLETARSTALELMDVHGRRVQ